MSISDLSVAVVAVYIYAVSGNALTYFVQYKFVVLRSFIAARPAINSDLKKRRPSLKIYTDPGPGSTTWHCWQSFKF